MIALADYMRLQLHKDVWVNHIPSGELRTPATGALLKRMGHKPGWPDFILLDGRDGSLAFIELKRGARGKLSPHQQNFAAFCHWAGFRHAVCRSFPEAETQLRAWGMLGKAKP